MKLPIGKLSLLVSLASSLPTALGLPSTNPPSLGLASLRLQERQSANNTDNLENCTGCENLGNFNDPLPVNDDDPLVRVKNGTYAGVRLQGIDANATQSGIGVKHPQDLFLGMPFAKQPTGQRRYRRPQSLDEQDVWNQTRPAKRYSEHCPGKGTDDNYMPPYITYKLGEECLTLNVVRPANHTGEKLPVWVFIHGGGFYMGGSGDRRYNGSWIVDRSVELGQPIIYASLNYRLNVLGFPVGDDAEQEGLLNLGLYDQRLALNWIKENIGAFGGDPEKVTINGESAGGASMLFHLTAYEGRDDKLFRGVAVESGYFATGLGTQNLTATNNKLWNDYLSGVGCPSTGNSTENFECLRGVDLRAIQNVSSNSGQWSYFVYPDGDLVSDDLQASFRKGKFVKDANVLLIANSDEGTAFGVRNLNTSADIVASLSTSNVFPDGSFTSSAQEAVLSAYPDDEDRWPPYSAGDGILNSPGKMDRRSCAIYGDLRFIGPRREVSQRVSSSPTFRGKVYSARFDQVAYNVQIDVGATHFQELVYVFHNPLDTQNALGKNRRDLDLSDEMNAYWVSFVATGNPNTLKLDRSPAWPSYAKAGDQMHFTNTAKGLRTSVEKDDFRERGIQLLSDIRANTYKSSARRDEL
ncbi:alpha/beta-hydrolase [Violaceomyces palustris]|uniref:Alpha/beta-hydrolase n=1 Tax=Violaceomyces palustris TaxID=1673888 RepID=A0ACD0P353_9BASI|nr:alpha/beta-hydrolase [Violaceomyces palustris]